MKESRGTGRVGGRDRHIPGARRAYKEAAEDFPCCLHRVGAGRVKSPEDVDHVKNFIRKEGGCVHRRSRLSGKEADEGNEGEVGRGGGSGTEVPMLLTKEGDLAEEIARVVQICASGVELVQKTTRTVNGVVRDTFEARDVSVVRKL